MGGEFISAGGDGGPALEVAKEVFDLKAHPIIAPVGSDLRFQISSCRNGGRMAQREHSTNMGSFITLAFDQFELDDSTSRVSQCH